MPLQASSVPSNSEVNLQHEGKLEGSAGSVQCLLPQALSARGALLRCQNGSFPKTRCSSTGWAFWGSALGVHECIAALAHFGEIESGQKSGELVHLITVMLPDMKGRFTSLHSIKNFQL